MEAKVKVYGTKTCEDTIRSRAFLKRSSIPYAWIDVDEDKQGEETIKSLNNGNRSTPTIVFDDGAVLIEPSDEQLAQQLGL
ncbi:MAG: glutaredoxin domain-containing protein [Chloroflexi bacterium]|nr:glutaredoxin domain-containing protein [Chloroflexota bacterium]